MSESGWQTGTGNNKGNKGIDDAILHEREIRLTDADVFFSEEEKDPKLFNHEKSKIPTPEFPKGIFPEKIDELIDSASESLPCPRDYLGVSVLAVASAAIGRTREAYVKPGWDDEPCSLYVAIVGSSGTLKTPSMGLIMSPLNKISMELARKFEVENSLYEQEETHYKAALTAYKQALSDWMKGKPGADEPTPPTMPVKPREETLVSKKYTVEALGRMMMASPRGLILHHDELVSWLGGMNAYRGGQGADRQFFLEIWKTNLDKVDRMYQGGSYVLEKPFLSIIGSIQPDYLQGLNRDQHGNQTGEDGFLPRILFSYPDLTPEERVPGFSFEKSINPKLLNYWEKLCRRMHSLGWKGGKERQPKKMMLTDDARMVFQEWYEASRSEVMQDDFPKDLEAFWSKMKAYVIRFMMIVHNLRYVSNDLGEQSPLMIDEKSASGAIRMAEYFSGHTKKVYQKFSYSREDALAEKFIEWLTRTKKTKIRVRDLCRSNVCGIKDSDTAVRFLRRMEARGLGRLSNSSAARRNSLEFEVVL